MKRSIAALALAGGLGLTSVVVAGVGFADNALAQEKLDKVVKVGSLGDQSGLYQGIGGPGSTVAAQMAIEDSGLLAKG
jgi:branched-chain amino acid transport system substrate-binding protein